MTILRGVTIVKIGNPYNVTLWQPFKIQQGQSYIKEGYQHGYDLIVKFAEKKIKNPTTEDFQNILSVADIKVNRITY